MKLSPYLKTKEIFKVTFHQIEMKKACNIAAKALEHIRSRIRIGMTAEEADQIIHDFIISQGAYPSGVGFMGFPKSVCISTNDSM